MPIFAAPLLIENTQNISSATSFFHTFVLWISILTMLVAGGLLLRSLLRLYRKPGSNGSQPQPTLFNSNIAAEILWTLVPIIILIVLLILTFQAI